MALIQFRRDDMDGTEGESVKPRQLKLVGFGTLDIDLTEDNYGVMTDAVLTALEPFISKGSWTDAEAGDAVRQWAREQKDASGALRWPNVSNRGRIPRDIQRAYDAAHAEAGETTPKSDDNGKADNGKDNGDVKASTPADA